MKFGIRWNALWIGFLSVVSLQAAETTELKTILYVDQAPTLEGRWMNVFSAERNFLGTVTLDAEGPQRGTRFFFEGAEGSIRLARAEVSYRWNEVAISFIDLRNQVFASGVTWIETGFSRGQIQNSENEKFDYVREQGWWGKVTYRLYDSSTGELKAVWLRKARKLRDHWEIQMVPGFERTLDPSVLIFMASIKTWSDSK